MSWSKGGTSIGWLCSSSSGRIVEGTVTEQLIKRLLGRFQDRTVEDGYRAVMLEQLTRTVIKRFCSSNCRGSYQTVIGGNGYLNGLARAMI